MEIIKNPDGGMYLYATEYMFIGADLPGTIEVPYRIKIWFDHYDADPETDYPETIDISIMEIPSIPDCSLKTQLINTYMKEYEFAVEETIWKLWKEMKEKEAALAEDYPEDYRLLRKNGYK